MRSYLSLIPISADVHRRQNRMTLLCIIFAVFLVTSIFSMADMLIRSETASVREKGGNWHIYLEGLTEAEAAAIAGRPDVAAASWYDTVNIDKSRAYFIGGIPAVLGGVEDAFRTDIMTYFPSGADLREGEVILTPNAGNLLGAAAGDDVTLDTPAGSYVLRVTGFRSGSSRYATDSGAGESTALLVKGEQVGAFLNIGTFRRILNENQDAGNPVFYVQFDEKANIKRALAEIRGQFPDAKIEENLILLAAAGASENPAAKSLYPLAAMVSLLVLLAGVLMISGSLNSTVAQRTRFFGMMRCIGMSRSQIIRFVRLEALNWCKTAIPAGVLLGTAVSWGLCAFLRYFVGGEFSKLVVGGVSVSGAVCGAVMGIVTVLIAAQSPARRAAKVSPAAAVSGNADSGTHRHGRTDTRFLSVETALGISHAMSSEKSLFLMAGSFALSIILFLCFSVLVEALGCVMPTKSYSPDVSLSVSEDGALIPQNLVDTLRKIPGVRYVFGRSGAFDIPAVFDAEVPRDSADLISYDDIQLDWILDDGDLRRGGDLKKVYGDQGYVLSVWDKDVPLEVGDRVTLNGVTLEIAGQMTSNPFSNNGQTGGDVILICSEETYARLTGAGGYRVVDIQMMRGASDGDVEVIHELTRGICDFTDRREEGDLSTVIAFRLFLYGFLAIIALITVLNIVNSISMSVSAKIRQYGAMRAVGMDGRQLTKMIAAEAAAYAVTGGVIGCGIGLPLSRLMYGRLITKNFPYYTWSLPVGALLVILLFVLTAAAAAVYAPSKRIRRMEITETINEL